MIKSKSCVFRIYALREAEHIITTTTHCTCTLYFVSPPYGGGGGVYWFVSLMGYIAKHYPKRNIKGIFDCADHAGLALTALMMRTQERQVAVY